MKAEREFIPQSPQSSLYTNHTQSNRYDNEFHHHPEYELTFIMAGSGIRHIGDSIQPFGPMELSLIPPNRPHLGKSASHAQKEKCEAVAFQFLPEPFLSSLFLFPEGAVLRPIFDESSHGISFDISDSDARSLADFCVEITKKSALEKVTGLIQFFSHLSKLPRKPLISESYVINNSKKERERIEIIYNYINTHFHRPLRLEEVAEQIPMNPESFCRFFKRTMGVGFSTFCNQIRIAESCRLLDDDISITQIALQSGFANVSNFNRRFKEMKGMAPRDYRTLFHTP